MGGRNLASICHAKESHAYLKNDSNSPDISTLSVLTS
jgi:hypothetical protein